MTECTWTGAQPSYDWNAPKHWNPYAPGPDDDLIVTGGQTYDAPLVPPNTTVRRLRLSGGGLQGRIAVRESVLWQGGYLTDGVEVGSATLAISGQGGQSYSGAINVVRSAVVADTEIKTGYGSLLDITGTFYSDGSSVLRWSGGANPTLRSTGTIDIQDGTLTLSDVIVILSRSVIVAPGAVLDLQGFTIPSVLHSNARVRGGGVLRLSGGGRLYAMTRSALRPATPPAGGLSAPPASRRSASAVGPGTTLELADGTIEDSRIPQLYGAYLGQLPDPQGLLVDGLLRWTGGIVRGDVVVGRQGVLSIESGPTARRHDAGRFSLGGSGAISADLTVDFGTLRNERDLVLQAPAAISSGRGWTLDNRWVLRVIGQGRAQIGDNSIVNRGTIAVEQGTLRHMSRKRSIAVRRSVGNLGTPSLDVLQRLSAVTR